MKRHTSAVFALLLFCLGTTGTKGQVTNRIRYTLLNPSYFADECLLCGRPTILEPLRGTFDLVLVQDTPPLTKYAVESIQFTASAGSPFEKNLTGGGTYQRFEEFALTQDMVVNLEVADEITNQAAFFTNATPLVNKPFPLIELTLVQTNGNFAHTFTIQLLAAPVREIWFSTLKSLTATNSFPPTNAISAGDLISTSGRVIKRNGELTARLGIMPVVPDLGLDAVDLASGGEILFSVPVDVFSETLGPIQHGDLLSNRGAIVKSNQDLLAAFHPASTNDAGLDAVQVQPDGQILFSIQSNIVVSGKLALSRGDILSDQGYLYMTHQQLLSNFQPAITNHDFGLASFRVLPSGEIWFSVEEGFTDNTLGVIQPGDLLSTVGYKVFSNQDLLGAFVPGNPSADYGLDALFVVTDTQAPKPPPRILKQTIAAQSLHLEWEGPGAAFQVETASNPFGPWVPASSIGPDLSWDTLVDTSRNPVFFRLRQW